MTKTFRTRLVLLILGGVACIALLYCGGRFYCQHAQTQIFVVTEKQLSDKLRDSFSNLGTNAPTVFVDSIPYESANDKRISQQDISKIRSVLAWKSFHSYRPSVLEIHSPTNVVAIVPKDRKHSLWINLTKTQTGWQIESATRSLDERIKPNLVDRVKDFFERLFPNNP